METVADLEKLATKLNPAIGFYDPMNLAEADFWGQGQEATIGFLRHAEIKHGRVAMMAFVGFVVQSNSLYWPWKLTDSVTHAQISAAGSPFEQWDALPTVAKLQILAAIGILEFIGEGSLNYKGETNPNYTHYMRGGKPGVYPSLKTAGVPHPVPFDLFDPFGLSKNASPEKKERGLVVEINNGRAAMIGIFGFLCAAKGCVVPGLDSFIAPYAGEPMAPFSAVDADKLPLVTEMLSAFNGAHFAGFK